MGCLLPESVLFSMLGTVLAPLALLIALLVPLVASALLALEATRLTLSCRPSGDEFREEFGLGCMGGGGTKIRHHDSTSLSIVKAKRVRKRK